MPTGARDAKGNVKLGVKLSSLAYSLAAGAAGSNGPIGLFEADHGAASIIGAVVKSKFQRRQHLAVRHQPSPSAPGGWPQLPSALEQRPRTSQLQSLHPRMSAPAD